MNKYVHGKKKNVHTNQLHTTATVRKKMRQACKKSHLRSHTLRMRVSLLRALSMNLRFGLNNTGSYKHLHLLKHRYTTGFLSIKKFLPKSTITWEMVYLNSHT